MARNPFGLTYVLLKYSLSKIGLASAFVLSLFLYLAPGIFCFHALCLQTFDFAILYQATYLASQHLEPFLTVRGVHALADNQEYLQFILSPLHYVRQPHYWFIVIHGLMIWACGLYMFVTERSISLAIFTWLSPFLLNMSHDLVHIEAVATILFLLCFSAARKGNKGLFFLTLFLLLATKEDIAVSAGCFCLLAGICHVRFRLQRRWFFLGALVCAIVLPINLLVMLPHYKALTCSWLGANQGTAELTLNPASPFLSNIYERLQSLDYYKASLLRPEVGIYLLKLFWPLLLVVHRTSWFILLPLPAALINILANNIYFVETYWHYDHSSFAMILIALRLALEPREQKHQESEELQRKTEQEKRYRRVVQVLLGLVAVTLSVATQPKFRPQLKLLAQPEKWYLEKFDHVRFLEKLNALLPPQTVVSADFFATSYLMRKHIYSFPNPFMDLYFGLDDSCTTHQDPPLPDIVILRLSTEIPSDVKNLLETEYDSYTVQAPNTMRLFTVYVRSQKYLSAIRRAQEGLREEH